MNRTKFIESLNDRLDDIDRVALCTNKNSVPFEKLILYLADKFKTGNFVGKINILINKTEVLSPRIEEETNLNKDYGYLD